MSLVEMHPLVAAAVAAAAAASPPVATCRAKPWGCGAVGEAKTRAVRTQWEAGTLVVVVASSLAAVPAVLEQKELGQKPVEWISNNMGCLAQAPTTSNKYYT